ncbi:MAG: hypothetical protein HDT40_03495 [Lachnospiraceae bacterium]|nr:hypothetical protein [Lachnospiraceae bacterium]
MNNRKKGIVIIIAFAFCCILIFIIGKLKNKSVTKDNTTSSQEEIHNDGSVESTVGTESYIENENLQENVNGEEYIEDNGSLNAQAMAKAEKELVNSKGNIIEPEGFINIGPYGFEFEQAEVYYDKGSLPSDAINDRSDKEGYWFVVTYNVRNNTEQSIEYLIGTFSIALGDGEKQVALGDFEYLGNEKEIDGLEEKGCIVLKPKEIKRIQAVFAVSNITRINDDVVKFSMEEIDNPQIYLYYRRSLASGYYGYDEDMKLNTDNIYFRVQVKSWE